MMMFNMKSANDIGHWSRIYVIVTVSTMLIESVREVSPSHLKPIFDNKDHLLYPISM
jgi:hypothetical protein